MVPGLCGESKMIVKEEDLVSSMRGMAIEILSTPRLIQLMEEAAIKAIQEFIPNDQISLGAAVKIRLIAATPLGMEVTANALLKETVKNRLFFLIDAYDEKEKIAEGEHERVIISRKRFLQGTEKKRVG